MQKQIDSFFDIANSLMDSMDSLEVDNNQSESDISKTAEAIALWIETGGFVGSRQELVRLIRDGKWKSR